MRIVILLIILTINPYVSTTNILIIHSYHQDYPWSQDYRRAIRQQLPIDVAIDDIYLDSKRSPLSVYAARADDAWRVFKATKPTLVVLADDNAIALLSGRFASTDTPVVFLGLNTNPRDHQLQTYRNFTGVLERPLFKRALLFVDCLLPDNADKKLLLLSDASPTSKAALKPISPNLDRITIGKLTIDFKLIETEKDWQKTILSAKENKYQGIFIALYHTLTKADKKKANAKEVIAWTSKHSPLPHFGFWDFTIGQNANVGGYVLDGYQHGKLAAEQINQILAGASPGKLSYISDRKGRFKFSRIATSRWQLTLPENIAEQAQWVE